ncbi:hypothetical protein [Actinokineospora cianjurensis]|uniref:Ig-like domain-containing protein n=1 Tax=Actinokineospora cianjurensis TaxID=585224 RepID=A0A421B373_9PSEU|nr:hypothetical protein [Actinokineospora cianjurensis]RLK58733.1 hypothetical protein CLV68_3208 [Actinokineospora cianjurensis]
MSRTPLARALALVTAAAAVTLFTAPTASAASGATATCWVYPGATFLCNSDIQSWDDELGTVTWYINGVPSSYPRARQSTGVRSCVPGTVLNGVVKYWDQGGGANGYATATCLA